MADVKISALPAASTPLAGTEVLPIVQGGTTDKVSVADLTAGRTVAAATLNVDANSTSAAVRITQTGAGNALLVEDTASPDASPFVVSASGNVGIGNSSPGTTRLYISSNRATDPTLQTWDTFNGASFENTALLSYDGTKTFFYNFQANPLAFGTNATERMRIDASGNVGVGTAALATTATNGFLYIPTCPGTPTGTPTTITGLAPIVVDSTNNKLYFYSGGQWRDAGP